MTYVGFQQTVFGSTCTSSLILVQSQDDGISRNTMIPLLDLLDRKNVKATFFVNGVNFDSLRNNADLVRRMRESGHCVGSHGYFHFDHRTLDYEAHYANLKELDSLLRDIMGVRPRFFRPPYGGIGKDTTNICNRLNYDIVM